MPSVVAATHGRTLCTFCPLWRKYKEGAEALRYAGCRGDATPCVGQITAGGLEASRYVHATCGATQVHYQLSVISRPLYVSRSHRNVPCP